MLASDCQAGVFFFAGLGTVFNQDLLLLSFPVSLCMHITVSSFVAAGTAKTYVRERTVTKADVSAAR